MFFYIYRKYIIMLRYFVVYTSTGVPVRGAQSSQQIVETEHLFKCLLEQPNGLARRILAKAGSNPTGLLDKTEDFIRRQPRVTGDSQQVHPRRMRRP